MAKIMIVLEDVSTEEGWTVQVSIEGDPPFSPDHELTASQRASLICVDALNEHFGIDEVRSAIVTDTEGGTEEIAGVDLQNNVQRLLNGGSHAENTGDRDDAAVEDR